MKTRKFKRIMGAATAASVLSTCIVGTNLMVGADGETVTSDYTLTIPATLAVESSGWNALEGGISAKGTLESGKKLVVKPTSENSWNLVANKGEETESKVGYNLATTGDANSKYSAAAEAPTWEFTELTADGTSQTAGIVVDDYSEKPAGTYQDTVTFTAKVEDAAKVETLLTTITATGIEQASYSTANVATVSFSYSAGGSSAYLANWGWWGYGWTATVTPTEGYTITKCVFYDDANRTATDSEAPFVVETTEEDKTPKVNGNVINSNCKGIKKIDVYGYAN